MLTLGTILLLAAPPLLSVARVIDLFTCAPTETPRSSGQVSMSAMSKSSRGLAGSNGCLLPREMATLAMAPPVMT